MATKKPKGFSEFTPDEYADYLDEQEVKEKQRKEREKREREKIAAVAKKQKNLTGFTASEFRKGLLEPDKFKKKLGIKTDTQLEKTKTKPLTGVEDITFILETDSVTKDFNELGKALSDFDAQYRNSTFYKIYKGRLQVIGGNSKWGKELDLKVFAGQMSTLKSSITEFIRTAASTQPLALDKNYRDLFGINVNPFYNPILSASKERQNLQKEFEDLEAFLKSVGWPNTDTWSDEDAKKIRASAKRAEEIKNKITSIDGDVNTGSKNVAKTTKGGNFVRRFDGVDGKTKYRITMVFGHQQDVDLYELREVYLNIPLYKSSNSYEITGYSERFTLYNKLAPITQIIDLPKDYKIPPLLAGSLRPLIYLRWLSSLDRKANTRLTWVEFIQKYDPFTFALFPDNKGKVVLVNQTVAEILKRFEKSTVKARKESDALDKEIRSNKELQKHFIDNIEKKQILEPSLADELRALLIELNNSETLGDAAGTLEKLQKLYGLVLHKYDLKELVGTAIECANKLVPFEEVERLICKKIFGNIAKAVGVEFLRGLLKDSAGDVEKFATEFADVINANFAGPMGINAVETSKSVTASADQIVDFANELEQALDFQKLCSLLLENVPEFLRLVEQSIESLGAKFDDLSKMTLPKPPSFSFPIIKLPDPLSGVTQQTEQQMFDALARTVYSGAISLLTTIIDATCVQDYNYGEQIITRLIPDGQKIADVFNRFGIGDSDTANEIGGALEKLSLILTGTEICALLSGVPSGRVLKIVKTFMDSQYPKYRDVFADDQRIGDLFLALGTLVDDDVCQSIRDNVEPLGDNCFDNPRRNEIRQCYMKGVGVTDERLNDLFREMAAESSSRLEELIRIADQKDPYSDDAPSPFCDGEKVSLFPKNNPAITNAVSSVVDTVFNTVEMSFDESIASYTKSLLKKEVLEGGKDNNQSPATQAAENLLEQYNNQYKSGVKSSLPNTKDGVFEDSRLNSFIDSRALSSKLDLFKFKNTRKKVQPDLYKRLDSAEENELYLYNKGNYVFSLPKTPEEEQAEIYGIGSEAAKSTNFLLSRILPLKKNRQLRAFMDNKIVKDDKGKTKITDEFKLDLSISEVRKPPPRPFPVTGEKYVSENECRIYTVFMPITLGIAKDIRFFERLKIAGITKLSTQPIFPNFGEVIPAYHPEIYPFKNPGLDYNKWNISSGIEAATARLRKQWQDEVYRGLKGDDSSAFWPQAFAKALSSSPKPTNSYTALGSNLSDVALFTGWYNPADIRGGNFSSFIQNTDAEPDYKQVLAKLEKHWLDRVWADLKIAYTYRVFQNGEAYLVGFDLRRACPSSVPDGTYAGPSMNLDDWAKYNNGNLGQPDWNTNNDRFRADFPHRYQQAISGHKLHWINLFAGYAGVKGGKTPFPKGIPANEKARNVSKSTRTRPYDPVSNFSFFDGDVSIQYLSEMFTKYGLSTDKARRKFWDDIGYTNEFVNSTLKSGNFRWVNGQLWRVDSNGNLTRKLKGTIDIGFPKTTIPKIGGGKYAIEDILKLSDEPVRQFQSLGPNYFYGEDGTYANREYTILVEQRKYEQTSLVDEKVQKFIDKNNLLREAPKTSQKVSSIKFTEKTANNWETANSEKLSEKTAKELLSLNSKEKVETARKSQKFNASTFDYIFATMIRNKWEKRFGLSFPEITNFYLNNPYFENDKESTHEELRNAFINKIAKFISFSNLFGTTDSANPKVTEDPNLHETNLLEHVDFSPEPSESLKLCDLDIDLMRFREIKRQARDEYNTAINCMQGDFNSSEIDFVLSVSSVKVLIRLHCVEAIMAALFPFSMFNLNEKDVDDSLLDYVTLDIIETIKEEAEKINPGVTQRREAYDEALEKYNTSEDPKDLLQAEKERRKIGTDFYESFLEIVARLYIKDNPVEGVIDCPNLLMELVRKELVLASRRLKDVLYDPKLVRDNKFEPNQVLLREIFFTIGMPESEVEYRKIGSRFSKSYTENKKTKTYDSTKEGVPEYITNYYGGFYQPRTGFFNAKRVSEIFEYDRGGFFLEKYVKPTWRPNQKPKDRALQGYVDIQAMEKYLKKISFGTGANKNTLLKDYFTDLKFGLRLVYRSKVSGPTTSTRSKAESKLYFDLMSKCLQNNAVQRDSNDKIALGSPKGRVFMHEEKTWFEPGLTTLGPPDLFIRQVIDQTSLQKPFKLPGFTADGKDQNGNDVLAKADLTFYINWKFPFPNNKYGAGTYNKQLNLLKKFVIDSMYDSYPKNQKVPANLFDTSLLKKINGLSIEVRVEPNFVPGAPQASIDKAKDELVKQNWPTKKPTKPGMGVVTGKDAMSVAYFDFKNFANLGFVPKPAQEGGSYSKISYEEKHFFLFWNLETERRYSSVRNTDEDILTKYLNRGKPPTSAFLKRGFKGGGMAGWPFVGSGPEEAIFQGFVGLTPMIEVEENISLDIPAAKFVITSAKEDSQTVSLGQPATCSPEEIAKAGRRQDSVMPIVSVDFLGEYADCYEDSLIDKMIKTDDYSLLFGYMFPLEKAISLLSIHGMFYNKNTTNIGGLFDTVKNNLISLIQSVDNINNREYEDRRIRAVGGDRGLNKVSTKIRTGPSPELQIAERIFSSTIDFATAPLVILKGMTETFDPNIAMAKKVTQLVGSYKTAIEAQAQPILFLVEQLKVIGETVFGAQFPKEKQLIDDNQWLLQLLEAVRNVPDLPIHIPSIFLMFQGIIPGPQGWIYLLLEPLLNDELLRKLKEMALKNTEGLAIETTGLDLNASQKLDLSLQQECREAQVYQKEGRGRVVLARQYTQGGEYVRQRNKKDYIGHFHVHEDGTVMTGPYHDPKVDHDILEKK